MWRKTLIALSLCVFTAVLACYVMAQIVGQPFRLSDKDVEKILQRIEQQSDKFRSSLDSALDKSRFNGSNREDDINSFVKEFYKETKNLRDRFDSRKSTAPDVQRVLDRAARIDGFMRRFSLSSRAQDDWSTLKSYLDELASAYNVSWRWFDSGGYPPPTVGYPGDPSPYPNRVTVGSVPYRVSDREVEQILRRIEQQSDKFRSALDSALDKSRFNGSRQEDDINRFVKEFYEHTKTLRDHFDDHKSTSADVQSVLERAASIDSFMLRNRLRKNNALKEWQTLRGNLSDLARVYNVVWEWRY
jgi:hypothetical protein